MSSFYDEVDIQEAAVRAAVTHLGLDKHDGVFFLSVTYEDEPRATEPAMRLLKRLTDLTFIRAHSRSEPLPLATRLAPRLIDRLTGETGWPIIVGTRKWWSDGSAAATATVNFGFLASRGFTALARRLDGRWQIEEISFCFS